MVQKYFNSKGLAIFISLLILFLHYYIRTYNYGNWVNVLGWDVLAYYLYLPFTFIYHDPGMTNQAVVDHIFQTYNPSSTFYQAYKIDNGNWVSMYSIGFAILFSPFFFIAHAWASISGSYPADGFSFPYQYIIGNGVMIYIVAGVFVIRKVLLHFFSERITCLVMLCMLLGTNYFHEATTNDTMPHAMLFTAYSIILWLTIKWHQQPNYKAANWLGFILGLTILSRGSEIVAIFIPLLWNIYDRKSLLEKLNLIRLNYRQLLFAVACAFITPLIQMIWWKAITGSFIFQSYQNTEGFDWGGDYISKVLFSYKKSWFVYTPMIMLPIIGIYFMRKLERKYFLAFAIFFLTNFWLLASWAAWWQGGSFGMRYFVESYAVMAVPFGFFIKRISNTHFIAKSAIYLVACFFLFLNLFQTWQFNNWMIDGYAMTKEYYWKIFLKTHATDEDKKLMEIHRDFKSEEHFANPDDYNKKTIGFCDFEKINSISIEDKFIDTTVFVSPPNSCKITSEHIYSPTFRMPYSSISKKEHFWVRVNVDYYPVYDLKESPVSLVINFNHRNRYNLKYKGFDFGKDGYKLNEWNHLTVDYLTPYPLTLDDEMQVYVYLKGDKPVYIDNLHIEAFERKW